MIGKKSPSEIRAELKKKYDSKFIIVDGNEYKITKIKFKKSKAIADFVLHNMSLIMAEDISFMSGHEFDVIEDIICEHILFEDELLSKIYESHWGKFGDSYYNFMGEIIMVMSSPLLPGDDSN